MFLGNNLTGVAGIFSERHQLGGMNRKIAGKLPAFQL
jgi:hypothetical protein